MSSMPTACTIGLVVGAFAFCQSGWAVEPDATWAKIRPFFQSPAAFADDFGTYPSPLKFSDGRPVATAADWPRRRREILALWHREMGPWPDLLERPKIEFVSRETRAGVVVHRINLEIAPGVMQHGYLLVPRGAAPRPAVLVPFYAPEPSIDYRGPPVAGQAARYVGTPKAAFREFAWQLARRGFVTLAIGSPGDDAMNPLMSGATCQPLSYYAYIAANCHTLLAQRPDVDPARIGVMGHSYGGKWALFASCFHDAFAAAVWDDGGIVFDEAEPNANYWEPWYLGRDPEVTRQRGPLAPASPRTGAYKRLVEAGHDLTEVHALMAPRPFLVSGGDVDGGESRWQALNHAVAVNRLLGHENRVAFTSRPTHQPTAESNELAYLFLEHFLGPVPPVAE